jgi:hypothetical protein
MSRLYRNVRPGRTMLLPMPPVGARTSSPLGPTCRDPAMNIYSHVMVSGLGLTKQRYNHTAPGFWDNLELS